ncbi:tyrosinase family oxidase copper chaperone [Streptomyces bobili]|uniref:tyrosinase family oxidase copper chaperone n=1 Tax=Streptomyces bobili TaxID=67280 RepID=UPI003714A537
MVVSVDGAAVTAVPADTTQPGPTAPPGPMTRPARRRTRRDALRGLLGAAAALALAPLVAASRPVRRDEPEPEPAALLGPGAGLDLGGGFGLGLGETVFDVTYLGRHLLGSLVPPTRSGDAGRWEITVDGRPLHLMRRADGTWLSMVDHYRSYAAPLDAVRAAVDELGPGEMLRAAATGRHTHMGGHHGLHP